MHFLLLSELQQLTNTVNPCSTPWLVWSMNMKKTLCRDFWIILGLSVVLWEQGAWHTPGPMFHNTNIIYSSPSSGSYWFLTCFGRELAHAPAAQQASWDTPDPGLGGGISLCAVVPSEQGFLFAFSSLFSVAWTDKLIEGEKGQSVHAWH